MKYLIMPLFMGLAVTACAAEEQVEFSTEEAVAEVIQEVETLKPLAEGQKMARCVIGLDRYEGPCVFQSEENGSFYLTMRDGSSITPDVSMVSVTIISKGKAEVRGLTTDGINSRWGLAERSQEDPACWVGSDFEVCAY